MALPAIGQLLNKIGLESAARSTATQGTQMVVRGAGVRAMKPTDDVGKSAMERYFPEYAGDKERIERLIENDQKSKSDRERGSLQQAAQKSSLLSRILQVVRGANSGTSWDKDDRRLSEKLVNPADSGSQKTDRGRVDHQSLTYNANNKSNVEINQDSSGRDSISKSASSFFQPYRGIKNFNQEELNSVNKMPAGKGLASFESNAKSTGKSLAKLALTAGKTALKVAAVPLVFTALAKTVHSVSLAMSESQRFMVDYNSTIATSFAELDRNRMMRDIKTASNVSGSSKYANDQLDRLEEELNPFKNMMMNLKNYVTGFLSGRVAGAIESLEQIPIIGKQLQDWKASQEEKAREAQNMLGEMLHNWSTSPIDEPTMPRVGPMAAPANGNNNGKIKVIMGRGGLGGFGP